MIKNGQTVAIEYSIQLEDGSVVDTNIGKDPLVFVKGSDHILPALDSALTELVSGDSKTVVLAPAEAYGPINDTAFEEVSLESIPEDYHEAGTILSVQDELGREFWIRIHEITEQGIILDLNHPLAGHTLQFDVKILTIE